MSLGLVEGWRYVIAQIPLLWHRLWTRLRAAFVTKRFTRILSDFLAEVGVLVFVFPGLEIIIRNEPTRL